MGFAASQARLLLLTARKSDLEFRAQQITNSEMLLAMQTEEIARDYSNKLSNQTLKYNGANGAVDIKASTLFDTTQGLSLQVYIGPTPAEDEDFENDANWETWTASSGHADYDGAQILTGINNGTMRIIDNTGKTLDDVINGTQFTVTYNTEDDAKADAEYRRKTAALQVKEKRLQMDLQQIEAQQKACDTEIESVKKIMDKHIEKEFKVFS